MPRRESTNKRKRASDDGYFKGLKTEWNLFWQSILGDGESSEGAEPAQDPFVTGKLEFLNFDQIKAITKALSGDRRILNQRLEALKKEIEENLKKMEVQSQVDQAPSEFVRRVNELTDLGQNLSEQLNRINERLKLARSREDAIKKSMRPL